MNKRLRSPLNVQIEVTGECTSRCVHCYNFWREKDEKTASCLQNVSLSEKDALSILAKLGEAEVFNVSITGGEPLLNFTTTLSSIEYARSMNMGVGLNSNLVPLTVEKARSLKRAGLDHTLTSILGPTPEIHDSITQRQGSFRKLVEGIKNAQDAGIRVSANMVVSQINHGQVIETAKFVAKLGINNFMATKAGCPGNCSDFSHLQVNRPQLIQFLNDLCWIHENLGLHVDSLEPIPYCGLYGVKHPELFTSRRCNAGVTTATISYDGSVRPCPHLDTSCGNLLKEDLGTIWAKMDPWSQRVNVPTECSTCNMLNMCGSGCRMEAKTSTGKINGLDSLTALDHVEEMIEAIKLSKKHPQKVSIGCFKTPIFRLRREAFGGVFVSSNNNVFLDHNGFAVLSQLKSETTYNIVTKTIDWWGLDPQEFVWGLARRNAVSLI